MQKRQKYVPLELDNDRLDNIVSTLRDRLLSEFWPHVPEGEQRDRIKARLENNILAALRRFANEVEAT